MIADDTVRPATPLAQRQLTTLAELDACAQHWDELHEADVHGHVFLGRRWLRACLPLVRGRWRILTLSEGGALLAALPLVLRPIPGPRIPLARELAFATDPIADYQGLLCRSGHEVAAVEAFAETIRRLPWDFAAFNNVSDERVAALLTRLAPCGRLAATGVTRCLSVALPETYAAFEQTLGRATRQHTRRYVRQLEALPGFSLSAASDSDIDAHVDALLKLNYARWGGSLKNARKKYGALFRAAHANGCLRLLVVWSASAPVAAAASFVDRAHRTYSYYQTGFNVDLARLSPGRAIVSLAIRDAIELDYRVFDFLRGDEPYKRAFAKTLTLTTDHRVAKRSFRAALFDAAMPAHRALKAAAVRVVYGKRRRAQAEPASVDDPSA